MPIPTLPRWARRAVTVPVALAAPWALAGAAPAALPLALARDLADGDGRLWRTRTYAMALAYAAAESSGIAGSAALWAASGPAGTGTARSQTWHHRLQRAWLASILASARATLGLRFEVEGLDALVHASDRPLIVLGRHASLPDAFLPGDLFVVRADRPLRMVVKDDLAWVPCLDIVGHRLPNAFVDRTPADGAEAAAALARVTDGLGGRDVAVIFPEGTYPTATSRERALARLAERSPAHLDRAERLRHLLPPRPAGTLALLDAAPDADVAILGHVGLEQLSSMPRLARSLPLRHPVRARLWRVPRSEVPTDRDGRVEWLWRRWEALDAWVDDEVPHPRGGGLMGAVLGAAAGGVAVLMIVTWLISVARRDASLVDIVWGLGFVVVALVAFGVGDGASARRGLLLALVGIWGLRLAGYLAWRNLGHGEDRRYQKMRRHYGPWFWLISLVTVFALQGVLMLVVSTPVWLAASAERPDGLGPLAVLGVALWLVGFVFEAGGDLQLARFKADPAHEGEVMDRGFWRYTRHPNYFGDFCIWWGIWLVAAETGPGRWGIVGPIVMTVFLLRVSGVAMLERDIGKRRPKYADYIERTSAFFPRPPKRS